MNSVSFQNISYCSHRAIQISSAAFAISTLALTILLTLQPQMGVGTFSSLITCEAITCVAFIISNIIYCKNPSSQRVTIHRQPVTVNGKTTGFHQVDEKNEKGQVDNSYSARGNLGAPPQLDEKDEEIAVSSALIPDDGKEEVDAREDLSLLPPQRDETFIADHRKDKSNNVENFEASVSVEEGREETEKSTELREFQEALPTLFEGCKNFLQAFVKAYYRFYPNNRAETEALKGIAESFEALEKMTNSYLNDPFQLFYLFLVILASFKTADETLPSDEAIRFVESLLEIGPDSPAIFKKIVNNIKNLTENNQESQKTLHLLFNRLQEAKEKCYKEKEVTAWSIAWNIATALTSLPLLIRDPLDYANAMGVLLHWLISNSKIEKSEVIEYVNKIYTSILQGLLDGMRKDTHFTIEDMKEVFGEEGPLWKNRGSTEDERAVQAAALTAVQKIFSLLTTWNGKMVRTKLGMIINSLPLENEDKTTLKDCMEKLVSAIANPFYYAFYDKQFTNALKNIDFSYSVSPYPKNVNWSHLFFVYSEVFLKYYIQKLDSLPPPPRSRWLLF